MLDTAFVLALSHGGAPCFILAAYKLLVGPPPQCGNNYTCRRAGCRRRPGKAPVDAAVGCLVASISLLICGADSPVYVIQVNSTISKDNHDPFLPHQYMGDEMWGLYYYFSASVFFVSSDIRVFFFVSAHLSGTSVRRTSFIIDDPIMYCSTRGAYSILTKKLSCEGVVFSYKFGVGDIHIFFSELSILIIESCPYS